MAGRAPARVAAPLGYVQMAPVLRVAAILSAQRALWLPPRGCPDAGPFAPLVRVIFVRVFAVVHEVQASAALGCSPLAGA